MSGVNERHESGVMADFDSISLALVKEPEFLPLLFKSPLFNEDPDLTSFRNRQFDLYQTP
jgi:hypothetical protein